MYLVLPESCSFAYKGTKCPLPPAFIIEIIDETTNSKFMVGVACPDHKVVLEKKFISLQENNVIPQGKIVLTNIRVVHTDCVRGTLEDEEEVKLKRLND